MTCYFIPLLCLYLDSVKIKPEFEKICSKTEWLESQNSKDFFDRYAELKKNKKYSFNLAVAIIEASNIDYALEKFHKHDCIILSLKKLPISTILVNLQNINELPDCSQRLLLLKENNIICKLSFCDCCLVPNSPPPVNCMFLFQQKNEKIVKWLEYAKRERRNIIKNH
jgi:hypothetical protein